MWRKTRNCPDRRRMFLQSPLCWWHIPMHRNTTRTTTDEKELSDESRRMGLKMNIAKTEVMVVDNIPINVNKVLVEKWPRLRVLGTTLHPQGKEPGQRDTTKNHGRMGSICQTPGYLQKQHCHLPEETGEGNSCVLLAITYGAETWTLTKQAQNKLAAAQIKMERCMLNIKDQYLGQGENNIHRFNQHCKKNEMVLGRAYQPPQRRPMDLTCHHLQAIRQENTTREASQAVERRPAQILERHDLPEDSTKREIRRRHAEAFAQTRDTTAA